jgi:hypothetical protein
MQSGFDFIKAKVKYYNLFPDVCQDIFAAGCLSLVAVVKDMTY